MTIHPPTRLTFPIMLVLGLAAAAPVPAAPLVHNITVDVYKGEFASVNAFIFSDGKSIIILDTLRKSREAEKLAEQIKAMKLPVTDILISHGHTDHFTGMVVLRKAFPEARIVVANSDIKTDIKNYAVYMDSGGETGAEPPLDPALKPMTAANPNGFDYENNIQILSGNRLGMKGGATLELTTDYQPAEADHMTAVYSPELNALFLADFGYNGVHFWMGDDISWQDIANWRAELLRIKERYADCNPIIYPGHGDPTDMSIFDKSVRYIDDYTRIAKAATSRDAAIRDMIALYPDYKEANFFLKYSIMNHVKP
jgi:glyoxylase-like metal-dependent hydrolase (beta-lactamase superfamily II)